MQFPALLIADPHFTDNPRDEYRWGLWDWIRQTIKEEKVKSVIFLGDLTNAKDNHSAILTNRIPFEVKKTSVTMLECGRKPDIKILVGNHDWLLNGQEFFRFLNLIPGVQFITSPTEDEDVSGEPTFYLPYSKSPRKDWEGLDLSHYRWVFMHQTIKGARSSNGQEMEGEDLPDLSAPGKIYSGDIHVPQVIGPIEYVGSPYHVHFGDSFKPRCVLLERGGRAVDLHFQTISRVTEVVTPNTLRKLDMRKGDQVKLRVELHESEKHDWARIRREAIEKLTKQGVEVQGVELILKKSTRRTLNEDRKVNHSPSDAVHRFVMDEELGGEALDAALEIIES